MATSKKKASESNKQLKVRLRKTETVRERSETGKIVDSKPKRLRKTGNSIKRLFLAVVEFGRKEYYLPMPDNKLGRFLNKRRYIFPRYFVHAIRELRQVTWPTAKETAKLSVAVITFAVVFAIIIAAVDYVLDVIFKEVIL